MGHFPSLPDETNLADLLKGHSKGVMHLLRYHDDILRGPSPLSIGEREIIAAYVSGLNECRFCHNAHTMYAESYGASPEMLAEMMDDLESSSVPAKFKPILAYARTLTLKPGDVTSAHTQAILDAGWSEEAMGDALAVISLFNFMNRFIHGAGIAAFDAHYQRKKEILRKIPVEKREAFNESHLDDDHYEAYGKSLGLDGQS